MCNFFVYINIVFVLLYRERYRVESFNNTVIYEPEVITIRAAAVDRRAATVERVSGRTASGLATVQRRAAKQCRFPLYCRRPLSTLLRPLLVGVGQSSAAECTYGAT